MMYLLTSAIGRVVAGSHCIVMVEYVALMAEIMLSFCGNSGTSAQITLVQSKKLKTMRIYTMKDLMLFTCQEENYQ